jgi:hypothetical protein
MKGFGSRWRFTAAELINLGFYRHEEMDMGLLRPAWYDPVDAYYGYPFRFDPGKNHKRFHKPMSR